MKRVPERIAWIIFNIFGLVFGVMVVLGSYSLVFAHSLAKSLPDLSHPGAADYSPNLVYIIPPLGERVIEEAITDFENIQRQREGGKIPIQPDSTPRGKATQQAPTPTVRISTYTQTQSIVEVSPTPTSTSSQLIPTTTLQFSPTATSTRTHYSSPTPTQKPTKNVKPTQPRPTDTKTPQLTMTSTNLPQPTSTLLPAPTNTPIPAPTNPYPGPQPTQPYP